MKHAKSNPELAHRSCSEMHSHPVGTRFSAQDRPMHPWRGGAAQRAACTMSPTPRAGADLAASPLPGWALSPVGPAARPFVPHGRYHSPECRGSASARLVTCCHCTEGWRKDFKLPLTPPASSPRHLRRKLWRSPRHPGNEPCQPGMRAQRLDSMILSGQFRFHQGRVDLSVADMVQQNHWPAFPPAQFGNEMMQALWHIRRNRTPAKLTNW